MYNNIDFKSGLDNVYLSTLVCIEIILMFTLSIKFFLNEKGNCNIEEQLLTSWLYI